MAENTITIESTTASQEELNHAVSEEWRNAPAAKEEKNDETPGAPKAETGSESDTEHHGSKEGKKDAEDDLPVGVKKRIDKLTARSKAAEEQNAELLKRLEVLEKGKTPEKKVEAAKPPAERPKRESFDSEEKYEDAVYEWRKAEEAKKAESADIEERTKEVVTSHTERMNEAREKHEDFDEKLKGTTIPWDATKPGDVQASKAFQLAIFECENGPDVLYHIATHPEVAESFASLSPVKTQLLVGKISASLLPSETPKEKEPPKTKVNPPPKTVGGGSARASEFDPRTTDDQKAYRNWRNSRTARTN